MKLPFALTRARVIAASLLLLAAILAGFVYFKHRRLAVFVAEQVGVQAQKRLGRQVRLGKVSVSLLGNITLRDACVSRLPDFTAGEFFCAAEAQIRPTFATLLGRETHFSYIGLEKPVIRLRERAGRWDIADLLALIPDTGEGLHMTWNTDELELEDSAIEVEMESSGLSVALENADIEISHRLAEGAGVTLRAQGRARTLHRGKLVSALAELDLEANFEREGLSSSKGEFTAEDVSYGAASLLKFKADWELFNIRKPLPEKNYSVAAAASGLLIPAQEGNARAAVADGLKLFSAAMGKPVPEINDIEAGAISGSLRLDDSVLSLKRLTLRSNFMDLDASMSLDGPEKKSDATLKIAIGGSKFEMSAAGPLNDPRIKPLLSHTLSIKFKSALAGLQTSLLKIFPVTGETP